MIVVLRAQVLDEGFAQPYGREGGCWSREGGGAVAADLECLEADPKQGGDGRGGVLKTVPGR